MKLETGTIFSVEFLPEVKKIPYRLRSVLSDFSAYDGETIGFEIFLSIIDKFFFFIYMNKSACVPVRKKWIEFPTTRYIINQSG